MNNDDLTQTTLFGYSKRANRSNNRSRHSNRNNKNNKNSRRDNENVRVWTNTIYIFTKGPFKKIKSEQSQGYSENWRLNLDEHETLDEPEPEIKVYNCDTLVGAKRMIDAGLNPLVLNMASDRMPGGGVRKGSRAQEECLFRRTNYFMTLDKRRLPPDMYPLMTTECVYSPNVYVVKDTDNSILQEEDRFYANFIAIAAIRRPKMNNLKDEYRFDDDREDMYDRIERMYQLGIENGHDSLLLGAFGCGAFGNPPQEVVQIFNDMNQKYNGYFKAIHFAVLADKGNPNFDIFNKELTN